MKVSKLFAIALGSLALTFTTATFGQNTDQRIAELEARVAELQGSQSDTWLNERRAEEVKELVREVLQDAETRASLLENGMYAGHDGNHFFLKSADGGFLLNISGQIQFRHTTNMRDDIRKSDTPGYTPSAGDDNNERGFELRRTKIKFSGHIADPRLKYAIQLAVDRNDNSVSADMITIGYQLTDSFLLVYGEDKGPLLREEITSSKYQLAAERSYVNEIFTADKVQGVTLFWHDASVANDSLKVALSFNDGAHSGDGGTSVNVMTQSTYAQQDNDNDGDTDAGRTTSKAFYDDASDFALTGRVDVRIDGDWAQMKDFTSWPGEDQAIFIGAAFHWEVGETGDAFNNNDFLVWTIDASYENNGFSAFASVTGMSTDVNDSSFGASNIGDNDLYGVVVQVAYNIPIGDDSLEPFLRYEYIDFDNTTDLLAGAGRDNDVNIITVGANYYMAKHNAKITLDVTYVFDTLPYSSTGLGLLADAPDQDGQVVIRSQFQLLF